MSQEIMSQDTQIPTSKLYFEALHQRKCIKATASLSDEAKEKLEQLNDKIINLRSKHFYSINREKILSSHKKEYAKARLTFYRDELARCDPSNTKLHKRLTRFYEKWKNKSQ